MHYPFQTPKRVIPCQNEQSYHICITSECIFLPEWKSNSHTVTAVNLHWYDLLPYEILCWYYMNEYRATSGNWSELVPEWESRRYVENTPFGGKQIYMNMLAITAMSVKPPHIYFGNGVHNTSTNICKVPTLVSICVLGVVFPSWTRLALISNLKGGVHGYVHVHESKYFFAFARYDPSLLN